MAAAFRVEHEPRLIEAAVLAAVRGGPEERAFLRERDRVYEIADVEAREGAFGALHARWFERLALDGPFRVALAERPEIAAGCDRCLVVHAVVERDESADLRVAGDALPTLLVCVRAETVSRPARLLDLLRHELLHVADMLDPRFGYAPTVGGADLSPVHERLLRDRYRVLWDAYVDGRLARLGHVPLAARVERLQDFARAFPRLGARTEGAFRRFFDAPACTHRDLAGFAERPDDASPAGRCPLCGLPTPALEPGAVGLTAAVLTAIESDFASWRPADGICSRCAELYQQRVVGVDAG
jgi:hypothetical protein